MASPITTGVNVNNPVSGGSLDVASMVPQILEKILEIVLALAILAGSLLVIRLIRRKIQRLETAHEEQRTALDLLEKIVTGFVIIMAVTIALKTVGIDMTLLVSVAVLGLSYGLQDIIKNYVAGILILFKSPFKLGDIVKIKDFTGKISKMDFQSTALETFDNRHVTIYNSDVMATSIINYSKNTQRRLELDVTIGYGSDATKALMVFQKILEGNASVLKDPKYSVAFKKFTDVGATFTLKFWVQRPCNILGIRTDIASQIHRSFDDANIYMPYYKGIEAGDEMTLGKVTQAHEARVQEFYKQPLFEGVISPAQQTLDFEEPEA